MATKPPKRVVEHHALSYTIDATGTACLMHVTMDPGTRKVRCESLGHWAVDPEQPLFPTEWLRLALEAYSARCRLFEGSAKPKPLDLDAEVQLPLW